ncbi:MAG: hypothetical protein AB1480_12070 [Nitrospirota bacterium]
MAESGAIILEINSLFTATAKLSELDSYIQKAKEIEVKGMM